MRYITENIVEFETEEELNKFKAFCNSLNKKYMKAGEVMELLDISRETLCHYLKRGLIKAKKFGGQYRYDSSSVHSLAFVDELADIYEKDFS